MVYNCSLCTYKSSRMFNLRRHMMLKHSNVNHRVTDGIAVTHGVLQSAHEHGGVTHEHGRVTHEHGGVTREHERGVTHE